MKNCNSGWTYNSVEWKSLFLVEKLPLLRALLDAYLIFWVTDKIFRLLLIYDYYFLYPNTLYLSTNKHAVNLGALSHNSDNEHRDGLVIWTLGHCLDNTYKIIQLQYTSLDVALWAISRPVLAEGLYGVFGLTQDRNAALRSVNLHICISLYLILYEHDAYQISTFYLDF